MKFSIIVPVYGVEKYLDECVKSILAQTFADFELILVDDKSPDNCPKMCDDYALADSRIKVIHKEKNEGLGFARNSGMAVAKGEYVLFVDSDDTILLDTLEKCNSAIGDGVDILVYGMKLCYENKAGKIIRSEELLPDELYCDKKENKAQITSLLMENRVFQYAWNKAYRREFLHTAKMQFEQTKLIEDFLFNIEIFTAAEKIRSLNCFFYLYRKPVHETLASRYSPEFFALTKRKYLLEKEFFNRFDGDKKYTDIIYKSYIKHIVSAVIRNRSKSANLSKVEQKALIKEMMEDAVTIEALNEFEPSGIKFKLLTKMIKNRQVKRFYLFCGLVKALR